MSSMRKALRRGGLVALALAAVLAIGVGAASAAQPAAAKKAANWLALSGQLVEGTHFVTKYHEGSEIGSFADVGSTIDGNFAFLAANAGAGENYETQIAATAKWIGEHGSEYRGGGTCTGSKSGELFAGSTAKLGLFQLADKLSATESVKQLECLQVTSGTEKGRLSDQSEFGNFSNTFGQSIGVILLAEAGEATALKNAANYLVGQQCSSGAYRSPLGNTTSTCLAGEVEVDSTAIAAEALFTAGTTKATKAAEKAVAWLESQAHEIEVESQKQLYWESAACGSSEPSVNSTAVSSMAYAIAGEPGVGKAQRWIKSQQSSEGWLNGCADANAEVLNSNRVRASTQGVLGLLGVNYLDLATGAYAP